MATSFPLYAILLRAIGPVTHKLMSMAQWREASEAVGFIAPETLVSTGNMIADFEGTTAEAGKAMTGVLRHFGLSDNVVPILRKSGQLKKLLRANPIADAAQNRPAQTGVYFFAAPQPDFTWLNAYEGPEAIHIIEKHLVVDFNRDVAQSGRLIRLIDKQSGPNTSRNWNTTRKLAERCIARSKE